MFQNVVKTFLTAELDESITGYKELDTVNNKIKNVSKVSKYVDSLHETV